MASPPTQHETAAPVLNQLVSRFLLFVSKFIESYSGVGGFIMFTSLPYTRKTYREISPTTLLISITVFLFTSYTLVCTIYGNPRVFEDDSWDVLIFTQNWPSSVCNKWEKEGQNHTCYTFPKNTWTIHGLWPTKFGTIGPAFCNTTHTFNPEAIYGIEDELNAAWSPVEKHKKKYAFWAHEWNKHGTCASILPQLQTEFDYFYEGLELIKQYNMTTVLEQAGVSPGNVYNITQIWDGVNKVLGKKPQVACYDEKGGFSVLLEVRICFDKSLKLTDCNGTIVGRPPFHPVHYYRPPFRAGYQNLTNCLIERPVQYPAPGQRILQPDQLQYYLHPGRLSTNPVIEKLKFLGFAQWFTW